MKKYLTTISLFIVSFYFSQQTEGLRLIKQKYDLELENINNTYKKESSGKLSKKKEAEINLAKDNHIKLLNRKRNSDYLAELSKIKLNLVKNKDVPNTAQQTDEEGETPASPPKGIAFFNNELIENTYTQEIEPIGKISCIISFIIEKDGSISNVKAVGDNNPFNIQMELAMYLSEEKWIPAKHNGIPVRYKFRLPINLNFD